MVVLLLVNCKFSHWPQSDVSLGTSVFPNIRAVLVRWHLLYAGAFISRKGAINETTTTMVLGVRSWRTS
jgi:hypothetical protein